ncbi:MAG TPA: DMT family transporter [Xanthobacteraceae bacterium]|jgi:uncharacterized membrane protein|nr:DMT family transporter [Xanthobacteraceae bacterium]
MSWLFLAFSAPVLWAISTHLDKYLLERFFKNSNVAVMLVFTAIIGVLSLPVIWIYRPEVFSLSYLSMAVIAVSGIFFMGALYFYLEALQTEEASVVAPLWQTAPLFAYVLGYVFLGEQLSWIQIAGGLLIVTGTLPLSIETAKSVKRVKFRLVALMLACTISLAMSAVIFKIYALSDDFWVTTFWMYAGEAVFGVALLMVPANWRQFWVMLRSNPGPVLAINATNELANLGGSLAARYAMLFAPLSLVQAIGSTTLLFVFIFGILISLFFPQFGQEDLSRGSVLKKALSIALIGPGVMLINF